MLIFLIMIPSAHLSLIIVSNESSSIQAGNNSINQAYTNILAAERAGGNVSQLLASLNVAAELMAQAENAYQSGDLTSVNSNTDNARLIANQVSTEAIALKDASISASQNQFLFTIMFSLFGALNYLVVIMIIWRRFKLEHKKRLLSKRPEVTVNGT